MFGFIRDFSCQFGRRALLHVIAALALAAPETGFAAAAPKGDAARGKTYYEECAGCHSLRENLIGPRHCGVVGRKAAAVSDYPSYSEAMRTSGIVWTVKKLDEFLASPLSYLPDTVMGYVGISDAGVRADIIAYLQQASAESSLCSGL